MLPDVEVPILTNRLSPAHTGVLLEVLTAVGIGFTVTDVLADELQPSNITVAVYMPLILVALLPIVGFCKEEL